MYFFSRSVSCLFFHISLATDSLMDTLYTKEETNMSTTWGAMQQHAL